MPRLATDSPVTSAGGRRALLLLLALAVLARVVAAVVLGGGELRFADEAMYLDGADTLLRGIGLTGPAATVPGYIASLSLLDALAPGGILGLRIAQAAVLALGALATYGIGLRLAGPIAGLAGGLVYALDPLLAVSASLFYPDAPAALLLGGAVLLLWRDDRDRSPARQLVGGVLLGGFVLFRLVGLVLLPPMLLYVALGGRESRARRALGTAVFLAGWLLVVGPWVGYTRHSTGRWLPIATAVRGAPEIGSAVERRGVVRAVADAAARNPGGFLRRIGVEFAHFWEPYPTRLATDRDDVRAALSVREPRLATAPLGPRGLRDMLSAVTFGIEAVLALIGVSLCARSARRETLWLVGLVLCFALGYALFFGKIRYRIPILPIVVAFAGVGGATLLARVGVGQRFGSASDDAASQR